MRAAPSWLERPFQEVSFTACDGIKLNGWFFPATPDSPRTRWSILFCHGNAGNISDRLEMCSVLLERGVGVFVFDYRGYGLSEGHPSESGTYHDAMAACQWLQSQGFADQNIIAFGESLGGGVASELALRRPLGGLVLQSTFTSIPDIGAELFPWLPVRLLSTIKYDTCRRLPQLKIPVLVMHSPADELVPFHHATKNFALANEPKLFCELEGGHNEPLSSRAKFADGLERFLAMIQTPGVSGQGDGKG